MQGANVTAASGKGKALDGRKHELFRFRYVQKAVEAGTMILLIICILINWGVNYLQYFIPQRRLDIISSSKSRGPKFIQKADFFLSSIKLQF